MMLVYASTSAVGLNTFASPESATSTDLQKLHGKTHVPSDRIERSLPPDAYATLGNGASSYDKLRIGHSSTTALASSTLSDAQTDDWGLAAGVVGAAIGTVFGGGAGGFGGGTAGTLVAPGVGTLAGGIAGSVEGAALGAIGGGGVGYTVGKAVHQIVGWMSQSSSAGESGAARESRKPDPLAAKPYIDNPSQLAGRPASDIEKELDQNLVKGGHWAKSSSRDGNGVRYVDGKGGSLIINKGYPNGISGGDAVHQGPYVKIQPGAIRVPLAGNPVLEVK